MASLYPILLSEHESRRMFEHVSSAVADGNEDGRDERDGIGGEGQQRAKLLAVIRRGVLCLVLTWYIYAALP